MVNRICKLPKNKSFFLFGPRQTGKTSLIMETFPQEKTLMVNLLEMKNLTRYSAEPSLLMQEVEKLPTQVSHVFIDEIQLVPELLNEVHHLIETKKKINFILTGSSARKLKRAQANLLAGRAWTYSLYPFSLEELGKAYDLEKVLSRGTLPAIYLEESHENASQSLRAYVETYLREEIKAEALTRNLGAFVRFLNVAAQTNAEPINYSNIASDVMISSVTIKEYFSILEDTLIAFYLHPFHRSERKRHKTSPKFYFFDTGVIRAIQGKLRTDLVESSFEYGNLFETWVINEVVKLSHYYQKDFKLSFLRTADDVEVDLIIETPRNEIIAVEIKSKRDPKSIDYASGFKAIKQLVDKPTCICVCNTKNNRQDKDVEILNLQTFLNFLREK